MTTDYSALLTKLHDAMGVAVENQEYHRLMDLDVAVRKCVGEAVAASEENPARNGTLPL